MKLFVAAKYLDHKERHEGLQYVLTKVAAECRVDRHFVVKIEHEITENKHILAPEEIYLAHANSLKSYVYWLFCCTGAIVLESTVSGWFNHAFPIRGRLCAPNLIPYDKFRPPNIEKAWEYLGHISKISPERLKYGDGKSHKGKAIFNKLDRGTF